MTTHRKAVIALILANIIWGASAPVFKWSLEDVEPFTLAFLRFFIPALIILPFIFKNLKIRQEDIKKLILLSICITINIGLFFLGLQLTSSINAPIIASAAPILLILSSIFFFHEKPKNKVLIGTFVSLVGVCLIIVRPLFETGVDGKILGNLLLVAALLGNVMHTVLLKAIAKNNSHTALVFWQFIITALCFFPFMFWEAQNTIFLSNLSLQGITGIIFGSLFSSLIAYLLFSYAVKYIVTNEVGIFVYIDPIVAALIAIPLLNETITFSYLLGAVLVFSGIYIAEGRLHYHPFHKLKG